MKFESIIILFLCGIFVSFFPAQPYSGTWESLRAQVRKAVPGSKKPSRAARRRVTRRGTTTVAKAKRAQLRATATKRTQAAAKEKSSMTAASRVGSAAPTAGRPPLHKSRLRIIGEAHRGADVRVAAVSPASTKRNATGKRAGKKEKGVGEELDDSCSCFESCSGQGGQQGSGGDNSNSIEFSLSPLSGNGDSPGLSQSLEAAVSGSKGDGNGGTVGSLKSVVSGDGDSPGLSQSLKSVVSGSEGDGNGGTVGSLKSVVSGSEGDGNGGTVGSLKSVVSGSEGDGNGGTTGSLKSVSFGSKGDGGTLGSSDGVSAGIGVDSAKSLEGSRSVARGSDASLHCSSSCSGGNETDAARAAADVVDATARHGKNPGAKKVVKKKAQKTKGAKKKGSAQGRGVGAPGGHHYRTGATNFSGAQPTVTRGAKRVAHPGSKKAVLPPRPPASESKPKSKNSSGGGLNFAIAL